MSTKLESEANKLSLWYTTTRNTKRFSALCLSTLLSVGFAPTAALANETVLVEEQATIETVTEASNTEVAAINTTPDTTQNEVADPVEPATFAEGEANLISESPQLNSPIETAESEDSIPVDENISFELDTVYLSTEIDSNNETLSIGEELSTEVFLDDTDPASNLTTEELFNGYFEKTLNESIEGPIFNDNASYGNAAMLQLNKLELIYYQQLKTFVEEIAAGYRSDTTLVISLSNYSDYELGKPLSQLTTDEAKIALDKAYYAIRHDCPYELYWHGLRRSTQFRGTSPETVTIRLSVNQDYAVRVDDSHYNPWLVNTDSTQAATQTVTRAQAVVAQYESLPDYEKIVAYKDWICEQVTYDLGAAYSSGYYGDPWAVINVFDNNPDTNVVCEGYARAFQYLCDLSTFKDPTTQSYFTWGAVDNEPHAWNTVTLNSPTGIANYLADVTHTDGFWSGQNKGKFLNGALKGSVNDGFVFVSSSGSECTYTYDPEMIDLYGSDTSSILNLSLNDYYLLADTPEEPSTPDTQPDQKDPDPSPQPDNNEQGDTVTPTNPDNKPTKPSNSDNSTKPTIKTGWQQSGNIWYYYNPNGTMLTGWQNIGGA